MIFISINFILELINYGINFYNVISIIFATVFVLIAVLDSIAIIHMIKSFLTECRPILSYQHKVKSYMYIHKLLVCVIINDIIFAVSGVFSEPMAAAIIFIVLILPIILLARWRFHTNVNILRKLVLDNLKSKGICR